MIENFVALIITGQFECLLCTYNPQVFNLFIYEETEAQGLNDLPKSFSKWQEKKKSNIHLGLFWSILLDNLSSFLPNINIYLPFEI